MTVWTETSSGAPSAVLLSPFAIDVSRFATGGDGSAANPFTGWDTRIIWAASKHYHFPSGVYSYATAPNWALQDIRLTGEQGTILKHLGSANAVLIDALAAATQKFHVTMENFRIVGNASTTNGIYIRATHHCYFRNIRIADVSAAGVQTVFTVESVFDNVVVHRNEQGLPSGNSWNVTPVNGFVLDGDISGRSNANLLIQCGVNAVSGSGIKIMNGDSNVIIASPSEGNARGYELTSVGGLTTLIGCWSEANTVEGVLVAGNGNRFLGGFIADSLHITGDANAFVGTSINSLTIDVGADYNSFSDLVCPTAPGTITDNGSQTSYRNVRDGNGSYVLKPNSILGAVQVKGASPTLSGATGLGAGGGASIGNYSTSFMGLVMLTASGAGIAAQGQVTVTFPTPLAGEPIPNVMASLMSGSANWDVRATVQIRPQPTVSSFVLFWDNNGVVLTSGSNYLIPYIVSARAV
jgi:hypothetical protein